jgi:tetratricopeptide (TPR) repeat protein
MKKTSSLFATLFVLAGVMRAQTVPVEVTSALGTKFYALPDDKGVVAAAQKNLSADPKNVDLRLKLALAQSSVRQYREAVETCTRGLAIAPANADLYLERGHRELGLREFKRARADLQQAVKLDPKKIDAYYHLGLAHYFLGEFAASAEAFGHAVELAPTDDSRINSSNWLYASLRRAKKPDKAAKALVRITPEMKHTEPHSYFYLSLVRFFQGSMTEADAVPPPPSSAEDVEAELRFDTVAYGVGNWHLYNGHRAQAQEYFRRIVTGQVWITWGFIGAEAELVRGGAVAR